MLAGAGARFESPEDAKKVLAQAQRAGRSDMLLAEANRHATDQAGIAERVKARAPAVSGTGEGSPEALVLDALRSQPGGPEASGFPKDLSIEQLQAVTGATEAGTAAIAREMFPGRKKLTAAEYQQVKRVAEGATGAARKMVETAGALGEPPAPAPTLTPAAGPTEAGKEVQQVVNHYHNTTNNRVNFDSAFFGGAPSYGDMLQALEAQPAGGINE